MWWCITTTFPSAGCSESRLVPDCVLYGPQQVPMCCVVLVQLFSARIVCVADICVRLSVGVFCVVVVYYVFVRTVRMRVRTCVWIIYVRACCMCVVYRVRVCA